MKHDMLSQQFKDLKGENRELVLAAAHIEDAKTGRWTDRVNDLSQILSDMHSSMQYDSCAFIWHTEEGMGKQDTTSNQGMHRCEFDFSLYIASTCGESSIYKI